MFEDLKLVQIETFLYIVGFLFVIAIAGYYIFLIQQGKQLTKESYSCSNEYRIDQYREQIGNRTEARHFVQTYLQQRNITVPGDALTVLTIKDTYRVKLSEAIYTQRRCTFRKAGTPPPTCIGKWFTLTNSTLYMEYGYPC